jgi:hypothetical protein
MGTFSGNVGAGANDATEKDDGTGFSSTGLTATINRNNTASIRSNLGHRFTGVNIPKGATITGDNKFQMSVTGAGDIGINLRFQVGVAGGPVDFSSDADVTSRLGSTTGAVQWIQTIGSAGRKASPQLDTILQALVDRPEYMNGDAIVLLVEGLTGTAQVITGALYENSAPNASLLDAAWTNSTGQPSLTTQAVSDILASSATGNGNITDVDGNNATLRGFVYDTSSKAWPGNVAVGSSGYANSATDSGSFGTGAYTKSLTGLLSDTTYYVRSYAQNTNGHSYGDEVSFTTAAVPSGGGGPQFMAMMHALVVGDM